MEFANRVRIFCVLRMALPQQLNGWMELATNADYNWHVLHFTVHARDVSHKGFWNGMST